MNVLNATDLRTEKWLKRSSSCSVLFTTPRKGIAGPQRPSNTVHWLSTVCNPLGSSPHSSDLSFLPTLSTSAHLCSPGPLSLESRKMNTARSPVSHHSPTRDLPALQPPTCSSLHALPSSHPHPSARDHLSSGKHPGYQRPFLPSSTGKASKKQPHPDPRMLHAQCCLLLEASAGTRSKKQLLEQGSGRAAWGLTQDLNRATAEGLVRRDEQL